MRLFWQLLATFALLIVFGIGATTALIGVAFRQITTRTAQTALDSAEPLLAESLADYYAAHDRSWRGVDQRLEAMLANSPRPPFAEWSYVLFDAAGQPVARGGPGPLNLPNVAPAQGTPILVDGEQVGAFVLQTGGRPRIRGPLPGPGSRPVRPFLTIERSFLLVAVVIGSLTLALAAIVTRRISAPLAAITRAAEQVAAGDLQVHVPGSSVREVNALAEAFNRMAADLAGADQLRRNITADVAHELRTPLTIIKGKLEGMLDGVYPGTTEHIAPVLEEANLLERLIDDLRLLSLAEAGQLPLHPETVAVADLCDDALRSFAAQAERQGIQLRCSVAPGVTTVHVDPQRMQQVLGNLLANSLQHTPAGGQIDLSATRHDHHVRIAVHDTGSGIAPDDLPHIFDRFWRADRARSRQGSSTGLGLAIARQFVEAQGGHISATSTPGAGTTIAIDLPLQPPRAAH